MAVDVRPPPVALAGTRRRRIRLNPNPLIRAVEAMPWTGARLVARYPKSAVAAAVAVTAATPVTVREVAGVVVAGAAAIGIGHMRGAGSPTGEPSLTQVAKFRKRKRAIRRRWVTLMADCGLARPSGTGAPDRRRPRLLRVQRMPLGVRLIVDGAPASAGVDNFLAVVDKLRAGLRCQSVKVRPAGLRIEILLRYERTFTSMIRFRDLPAATAPMHVTVGLDEDGVPVEKDLRLPHLMVGAQGSGKSSETWTILRAIVGEKIPFRLRVFDPKGGQEYGDLEDAAYEYERDPARWGQFIEHAHRALGAKQAALRAAGLRKVVRFTEEFPLDVMVIDELLTAMAFGAGKKIKVNGSVVSVDDAFMTYLSTARSAGCTVLASAQLAQKEIIGKIRGLFGYVTCLRIAPTERELVDILLGSGGSKAYPAHQLSAAERDAGIGYAALPRGVTKYRAAYLTDGERGQVVRGVADWTRRLARAGVS
jgi:hypothetical protein